jgi:hypothetical protein
LLLRAPPGPAKQRAVVGPHNPFVDEAPDEGLGLSESREWREIAPETGKRLVADPQSAPGLSGVERRVHLLGVVPEGQGVAIVSMRSGRRLPAGAHHRSPEVGQMTGHGHLPRQPRVAGAHRPGGGGHARNDGGGPQVHEQVAAVAEDDGTVAAQP